MDGVLREKPMIGFIVRHLRAYGISQNTLQVFLGFSSFAVGAVTTHYEIWKTDATRSWEAWIIDFLIIITTVLIAGSIGFAREQIKKTESEELLEAKSSLEAKNAQLVAWAKI